MGRASSLAAAKVTSASARRSTFWAILVVGRSPAVWTVGKSSASMPLTWVAKRPQRRCSVSAPCNSSSTFSDAGSVPTRSVRSRAGMVVAPSVSIRPGIQHVMPISRLVAVSLRPASSVLRRTLLSTGSVLREETARETTDSPRARFSCITESFTLTVSRLRAADLTGQLCRPPPGRSAIPPRPRRRKKRGPVRAGSVVDVCSLIFSSLIIIMPWKRGTSTLGPAR